METKLVKTTIDVWLAIYDAHFNDLILHKTYSSDGCMMTEWGLPGSDVPIMHLETRWDVGENGERLNERDEYWLIGMKEGE